MYGLVFQKGGVSRSRSWSWNVDCFRVEAEAPEQQKSEMLVSECIEGRSRRVEATTRNARCIVASMAMLSALKLS